YACRRGTRPGASCLRSPNAPLPSTSPTQLPFRLSPRFGHASTLRPHGKDRLRQERAVPGAPADPEIDVEGPRIKLNPPEHPVDLLAGRKEPVDGAERRVILRAR